MIFLMTFQRDSGVRGDRAWLKVICGSPSPSNKNSKIPETDSRNPETETGSLETEKRVHRIDDRLETGLHKDASQPGGPHKGGRRIWTPGAPKTWFSYGMYCENHFPRSRLSEFGISFPVFRKP